MGLFGRMKDAFANVTEDVEPEYELEEQDSSAVLPDESGVVSSGSVQVVDGEFADNAIEEASATEGPLIFPEIIPPSESDVEEDGADEGLDVALELSEMNDGLILEPVGETLEGEDDGQGGSFDAGELTEFSVTGEDGAGSLLGEGSFDGLDVGVGEGVEASGAGENNGERDVVDVAGGSLGSLDADIEPVEGSSLIFEGAEGDEESVDDTAGEKEEGSSTLWGGNRNYSEAEDDGSFVALEPSWIDLDSHYLGDYRSEGLRPVAVVQGGVSVVSPVVEHEDSGEDGVVVSGVEVSSIQVSEASESQCSETVEGVLDEDQAVQGSDVPDVENKDRGVVQEGVDDSPVSSRKWSPK